MQAKEMAVEMPTVRLDDLVADAVRTMAESNLPGLVIVDQEGKPQSVIPGSQLLSMVVSQYLDDSALARTVDEASADQLCACGGTRSIGDCLEPCDAKVVKVPESATVLDVAVAMSKSRSPLIAVVSDQGRMTGCITVNGLLAAVSHPAV